MELYIIIQGLERNIIFYQKQSSIKSHWEFQIPYKRAKRDKVTNELSRKKKLRDYNVSKWVEFGGNVCK